MQFLRGLRVNSPVLGLCWLLLIYLISSLPVEALPSQIHDVLPSEPYGFVAEKGLHRRAPPELESWDIYQKYKKRKEKSPEEKLPPGLSSSLPVAKRQTLDDNVSQLYTFNDRTVTVTKTILGQGGDGVVYKGTLDTKPVAVKMSSSKELAQAGVYMVDLKESPNVMEQLAIFRSESFEPGPDRKRQPMLFQVMPMMDGSLASWLETVNDDDFQRYHKSLARQSLQGLVNIHKKGIAHRDYKPDNIFVQNKDGEMLAYVGDLDRASDIVDTAMTGAGTQGYTSLEYMLGPSYDSKKGDVFAAGMSIMGMLFINQAMHIPPSMGWTGTLWKAILDAQNPKWPNIRKETRAERIKRKVLLHKDFENLLPGMTEELADVLAKALCPQKERYTAQEFLDKLMPLLPFEAC